METGLLLGLGAFTGFLSGLLGIGGGVINVPALTIIAGFPQKTAQGTALLAMIAPCFLASTQHAKLGNVAKGLLPALIAGAVLGGSLGASFAVFLPDSTLRAVCSVLFALIGMRYIYTSRNIGQE